MPGSTATGRANRVRKRGRSRPRVGLALAGGGPLGGIYEVGVLLALTDSLEGIDFNEVRLDAERERRLFRLLGDDRRRDQRPGDEQAQEPAGHT